MNQLQQFLPAIQWAQQQLKFGQVGATQIVNVPDLSAAIAAGSAVLSQAPLLTWRDPGTVIAMYGQELAGTTPKFATTGLRLQFPGDKDFVTNGSAGDFVSFLALFGPNVNWFNMLRRVKRGDNWVATFRNRDTVNTCTPNVSFAFVADGDLKQLAADYAAAMNG